MWTGWSTGWEATAWMTDRIKQKDAYGSVVVLPRGVSPLALMDGPESNQPLWLEYLRAGGRIVHIGDVPFNNAESPVIAPMTHDTSVCGLSILGLMYSWGSPYDGHNFPVTPTTSAKTWGLENGDGSVTGVPVENTSIAFHVYTVPITQKVGAADYFRNVRPDMPWSGLVKILQAADGNNDSDLRDVWRAANYIGKPVTIPPLPPVATAATASKLRVLTNASGIDGRVEFVRGEEVNIHVEMDDSLKAATAVQIELMQNGKSLFSQSQPMPNPAFVLKTQPFADGAYDLKVTALQKEQALETTTEKIGIRYLPPERFNFDIGYEMGTNHFRGNLEVADIHDCGMELHIGYSDPATVDAAVRNHVGFSLRCVPGIGGDMVGDKKVSFAQNPEYYRLNNEGKTISEGYDGGLPQIGLSSAEMRDAATKVFEKQVKLVSALPSFRPYVLTNDDFSQVYGWDYVPHVMEAFKAETGLDAPRKMEKPAKFGAIPDNTPWVEWFKWTLINVNGAYNKAETQGAVTARSDVRVGPIPGGMAVPLVQLWEPAQYPPYNFGKNGFNLISSYYYNGYWQPVMTSAFWMEIGRMSNRDLPEWNMPDVLFTAGYTRNNLYHYLAGGVSGLAYFMYSARSESSWKEMHHLGKVLHRIGLVQTAIKPAHRDIGMLNSFTSNCFDPVHTVGQQVYGYHNLMQAHFSVEMVDEDEMVEGRASQYKAILLDNVQYLRQSVYDALAKYAAGGGLVLLDSSIPFDIPGAKRLNIDIGMGTPKHVQNPGITDYGYANRIALIQKAISEYVKPQFESSDVRIVASPFAAEGVPYTWFVNAQNAKEYEFCRPLAADRSPKNVKTLVDWENSEMTKGPYTSTVEYDSLPGVPYDLINGKKLDVAKTADGRFAVPLSMDRFGGELVAWYPSEITEVKLSVPTTASANQPVHVVATVMGGDKPLAGVVPVEFIWHDPNGKESIMSGVRAAKNGEATFNWTPAVNDIAGSWTLQVNELASGKSAMAHIEVSK